MCWCIRKCIHPYQQQKDAPFHMWICAENVSYMNYIYCDWCDISNETSYRNMIHKGSWNDPDRRQKSNTIKDCKEEACGLNSSIQRHGDMAAKFTRICQMLNTIDCHFWISMIDGFKGLTWLAWVRSGTVPWSLVTLLSGHLWPYSTRSLATLLSGHLRPYPFIYTPPPPPPAFHQAMVSILLLYLNFPPCVPPSHGLHSNSLFKLPPLRSLNHCPHSTSLFKLPPLRSTKPLSPFYFFI